MKLADFVIDLSPLRSSPAFRAVFTARVVSLFGIGFTMVALPLQVYDATRSSLLVATVSATAGASVLAGTLIGGLLADRVDRRRLIITGRAAATLAFAGLALNSALPDQPALAAIYACAVLNGVVGTFSAVGLQASAPALVGRDKLPAAGALIALSSEVGMVAAPALGGIIIAAWGFTANYTVTAVASALTTLLVLRLPALHPQGAVARQSVVAAIGEGLGFAVRHRVVGPLLLLGFVQLLFAAPQVLIPEFTDKVLDGDATTAALLYTAPAVGALLGSLTSGWTGRVDRAGAVVGGAVLMCGGAVLCLGASPTLLPACGALVLLGLAEVVEEILRYSLLQSQTPDALRGRVNSVWTAQSTLGASAGALTLGAIAPFVGPAAAVMAGGVLTIALGGAVLAAFPSLRAARMADPADEADSAPQPT
ncbi:enterobactin transporter EntS [Nocardiopsis ansamitocini]|uniref:MFS transporter n=1 Tax=Nocardiopsis ansamitocini TaxID=1670832 RepID=A0A9W6UHI6_9ACTN|nr:enterobactin transporter EntS [Nocardiopsis ansamitocini]GLU48916.1 MFS transporter [Nocardiopsis ansamitocini]